MHIAHAVMLKEAAAAVAMTVFLAQAIEALLVDDSCNGTQAIAGLCSCRVIILRSASWW
jgi:hypothetical protein